VFVLLPAGVLQSPFDGIILLIDVVPLRVVYVPRGCV
jgi:hypothetical protein